MDKFTLKKIDSVMEGELFFSMGKGLRAKSREQRAKGKGQRAESKGQRAIMDRLKGYKLTSAHVNYKNGVLFELVIVNVLNQNNLLDLGIENFYV